MPTAGVVDTGYTTIIIQGNGLVGAAFGATPSALSFGTIAGIAPTYLAALNAQGETQWWAKWELPGNQASYAVHIDSSGAALLMPGVPVSVTDLVVDTYWSATGYASDIAAIPEPETYALMLAGFALVCAVAQRRGRRAARMASARSWSEAAAALRTGRL